MSTQPKREPRDVDLLSAIAALQRAAQRARETAARTGTPCYVMRSGRIVDALTGQEAKLPDGPVA
jgi:L-aminopeptidase/D-esterase-like protein